MLTNEKYVKLLAMKSLQRTLQEDTDAGLLPVLARVWGADVRGLEQDVAGMIPVLSAAMLDPERGGKVWAGLTDQQRGALQMLVGSGGVMPMAKFSRLFGEVRQMGAAQIEREKPLENPQTPAEALYYRGLIALAFEQADTGPRVVAYVPSDLTFALPLRQTSYSNLEEPDGSAPLEAETPTVEALENVKNAQAADTSIVDDLTTLLAYLQRYSPTVDGEALMQPDRTRLMKYLLKQDEERLTFLFGLGLSANLIELQNGKAFPKRAENRRWLGLTRAEQVKELAEAWRDSGIYRELWHVPGLYPEPGGELDEYDAAVARENMLELMTAIVPKNEWWSLDAFIAAVKESEPDFQRPGGDYESWYIRNDSNEYLQGFESWDAVEGPLLEFYVSGPMHWLGLADHAPDAARLTAYGRALLGSAPWPTPADPEDKVTIKDDGTLLISRKISRYDRFQAMRFTTWGAAADPYSYRLDSAGIQAALEQGIQTGHIATFINRMIGDQPMPPNVAALLENWRGGASAAVSMERLMVLRTTAPETLDKILDTPGLRRYLGARLGPMACVVRAGQWEALRAALGDYGMSVDLIEQQEG
jgi:hypothetical protein